MHIFTSNNVSKPVSVSDSDCETDERVEKKILMYNTVSEIYV